MCRCGHERLDHPVICARCDCQAFVDRDLDRDAEAVSSAAFEDPHMES